MKCPNCSSTLLMTERMGVEIDYCPDCRGVWLDKGELDKLLEKAALQEEQPVQQQKQKQWDDDDDDDDDDNDFFGRRKKNQPQQQKKRGGFLGNFFDFD